MYALLTTIKAALALAISETKIHATTVKTAVAGFALVNHIPSIKLEHQPKTIINNRFDGSLALAVEYSM